MSYNSIVISSGHGKYVRGAGAIASAGDFVDRGAKKRTDLAFLNGCYQPAILVEVCFVDSVADAECYAVSFEEVCEAIANVIGGPADGQIVPPPAEVTTPSAKPPTIRLDVEVTGDVTIIINGVPVTN